VASASWPRAADMVPGQDLSIGLQATGVVGNHGHLSH